MTEPALAASPPRTRALLLELRGPLDGAAVDTLCDLLRTSGPRPRDLLIRCDGITSITADAALRLWAHIVSLESAHGYRVRLLGMPDRFARQLRAHPLLPHVVLESELFADPFASAVDSDR